jgi:hypothetical protein
MSLSILSWGVRLVAHDIHFSWKVSSTTNIKQFSIEQSTDAVHFAPLMQVPVNGTAYNLDTLLSAVQGKFFRLEVELLTGEKLYTGIASIKDRGGYKASIQNDQLVLLNRSSQGVLKIMNIQGQTLRLQQLDPGYNYLPFSKERGVYVVNIFDNTRLAFAQVIIR